MSIKLLQLASDGSYVEVLVSTGSITTGSSTIDFGSEPGANETSLVVTGQTGITSGAIVNACFDPEATSGSHTPNDHRYAALFCRVFITDIIVGTGFTIRVYSDQKLNGTFSIKWNY